MEALLLRKATASLCIFFMTSETFLLNAFQGCLLVSLHLAHAAGCLQEDLVARHQLCRA